MPISQDKPNPKIKVIFQGFVISRVKDGNSFAEVGAVNTSNCHKPKISVVKTTNGETEAVENLVFDIAKDIELRVENTNEPKIAEYTKDGFDRKTGQGDKNDFRWFVGLDTELFKPEDVTVVPGKLGPVFRFNSAVFYTETRTKGSMKLKRQGQPAEPFGRAGEQIAANVYLDAGSRAILRNGIVDLLTIEESEAGTSYLILFNCECHQQIGESDFSLVGDVISVPPSGAPNTSDEPLVDFVGEPVGVHFVNSPEVPCFGGNLRSH